MRPRGGIGRGRGGGGGWVRRPGGGIGRRSGAGRRESSDGEGQFARRMGTTVASDGVWAHIEYALTGRQRRSAGELGPEDIMSYPHGAERGRDKAGRIALG